MKQNSNAMINNPRMTISICLMLVFFGNAIGQNNIKKNTLVFNPDNVERIELSNFMHKVKLNIDGFQETINNVLVADTVLCLYTDREQYMIGLYSGDLLYGTPIDISNRNLDEWPYRVKSDKYDVILKDERGITSIKYSYLYENQMMLSFMYEFDSSKRFAYLNKFTGREKSIVYSTDREDTILIRQQDDSLIILTKNSEGNINAYLSYVE